MFVPGNRPTPPPATPSPPLMPGGGVSVGVRVGRFSLKRSPGFFRPRRGVGFPARSTFHPSPPVRGSGCAPPLIPSGLHPVPGSLFPVRRRFPAPGVSVPGAGSHAPSGHGSPNTLWDISRGAHSPGLPPRGVIHPERKTACGRVYPPRPLRGSVALNNAILSFTIPRHAGGLTNSRKCGIIIPWRRVTSCPRRLVQPQSGGIFLPKNTRSRNPGFNCLVVLIPQLYRIFKIGVLTRKPADLTPDFIIHHGIIKHRSNSYLMGSPFAVASFNHFFSFPGIKKYPLQFLSL